MQEDHKQETKREMTESMNNQAGMSAQSTFCVLLRQGEYMIEVSLA